MDHSHHVTQEASSFFSTVDFMPHGHCYLWKPALVWLHSSSDFLIGVAYVGISILLYGLVKKIKLPFSGMFLAFGAFIAFCGGTHFMEVWTLWEPDYWLSGSIKVITAVASVATYIFLFPIRPKIIEMAHAARLSDERRIKLESAHKELESLYEKIKETDELKTQFFANVSHELRTPLALILGPAEQLSTDQNLNTDQRKKIDVILRNSRTLIKQVNDLLDIAKIEAGKSRPEYAQVDLVKLLRVTTAHFETVMQSKSIFFSLHAPESFAAEVDPDKMQRVIMNLLSNAVKFTPHGGRIRVSIQSNNGNAVIVVEDTGPGIKPEFRQVIFERFRQGEGGINRQFGGTGLGLAIAKDFVEMHRGNIRVVDSQISGATFLVEIPLKAPADSRVKTQFDMGESNQTMIKGTLEELVPQAQHPNPLNQALGRPTVLVCEDNPDMNLFVAECLMQNFSVVTAANGREGLEKAQALLPDLIVSDIMMPYMGGDQLLREVRSRGDLSDIPILLLSARADDELRVKLLKMGASDYVIKPFDPEELKARAANLISLKKTKDVLEEELQVKSNDLAGLAKELTVRRREAEVAREIADIAREQAEKANQVKGAFLTLASHELNTPMTSVYLNLQILKAKDAENLSERQKTLLERALTGAHHLKDLVASLLEYTRVESGRLIAEFQPIDLGKLSQEVVNELQPMAQRKSLEMKVNCSPELQNLYSDPRLVRVVINNLLSNAVKYTDEGAIVVSCRTENGNHIVSVTDTGPGIAKEDQERIFNPFEQLEPLALKSTSGVGLGLALVKQIVESLGGEIWLDSVPGVGSTFSVSFPSRGEE